MNNTCPICNKAGLPDYRLSDVVCPQCNSNLKPYKILAQISNSSSGQLRKYLLPFFICVAMIIVVVMIFNKKSTDTQVHEEINVKKENYTSDSINYFKTKIRQLETDIHNQKSPTEVIVKYKIKKGDCLSEISSNFYGDWKLFTQIEKDNNFQKPYDLIPGQILTIKIKAHQWK